MAGPLKPLAHPKWSSFSSWRPLPSRRQSSLNLQRLQSSKLEAPLLQNKTQRPFPPLSFNVNVYFQLKLYNSCQYYLAQIIIHYVIQYIQSIGSRESSESELEGICIHPYVIVGIATVHNVLLLLGLDGSG